MTRFTIAFDDSGGTEQLFKWNGELIPGSHPVCVLAGAYVSDEAVDAFEDRWMALRTEIGRTLGTTAPPPIHLRLMWGRSLPKKYRKGPNPYIGADFDDVQAWVSEAWSIIEYFVRQRLAGWEIQFERREDYADRGTRYFQHPVHGAEMRYLQRRSQKMYRGYHRLTTSPLLALYTRALLGVNELALAHSAHTSFRVLVDSFADSHGIDELETVESMKSIASLERIAEVSRVADSDDVALMQAADVVAYSMFRVQMERVGAIAEDVALKRILGRRRNGLTISSANLSHRARRRYGDIGRVALSLHYALARAHVASKDPEFAEMALVPVSEFVRRQRCSDGVGVSVLTETAKAEIRCRVPHMAKTPDIAGAP